MFWTKKYSPEWFEKNKDDLEKLKVAFVEADKGKNEREERMEDADGGVYDIASKESERYQALQYLLALTDSREKLKGFFMGQIRSKDRILSRLAVDGLLGVVYGDNGLREKDWALMIKAWVASAKPGHGADEGYRFETLLRERVEGEKEVLDVQPEKRYTTSFIVHALRRHDLLEVGRLKGGAADVLLQTMSESLTLMEHLLRSGIKPGEARQALVEKARKFPGEEADIRIIFQRAIDNGLGHKANDVDTPKMHVRDVQFEGKIGLKRLDEKPPPFPAWKK